MAKRGRGGEDVFPFDPGGGKRTFQEDPPDRPEQIRASPRHCSGGGRAVSEQSDVRGLGAIVLAASCPRRPGAPRPLLQLDGEPLVRRAARATVEAGLWPVVVVVGERADEVRAALAGLPVVTVACADLAEGVPASLRVGLRRLTECAPAAFGVLVLWCDQPAVRASHLRALASARGPGAPLAASVVAGSLALPALFPAELFAELRSLSSDAGCDDILTRLGPRVARVPLPDGDLDVETPEGWARAQRLDGTP